MKKTYLALVINTIISINKSVIDWIQIKVKIDHFYFLYININKQRNNVSLDKKHTFQN